MHDLGLEVKQVVDLRPMSEACARDGLSIEACARVGPEE